MRLVIHPERSEWEELLSRPAFKFKKVEKIVKPILKKVKRQGDKALRKFAFEYDHAEISELAISQEELKACDRKISDELKEAIRIAKSNIERFHKAQKDSVLEMSTMPGVKCSRKSVPISKVGLYIPGGTAPLFSTVLMLGVPAQIAGCREIVLCTPPDRDGNIHPAILYTARLIGIEKIFKVGGAQAIAAMAYGTESIPRVYKIFGPGNQYVTIAKQLVQKSGIAIDLPAGPSEVAVYADKTSHPGFVAADLLSQAEHGVDSQVLLVTTSEKVAEKVKEEIKNQLEFLPRKEITAQALEGSLAIVVKSDAEAIDLLNEYGAEHLILATENARNVAKQIENAGSVFIGHFTPESAGDYASGTNHTLPTNGYAKAYSGVSLDSFVKKITFQEITPKGLQKLGPYIEVMAAAEELDAHKEAVSIRLDYLKKK